MRYLIIISLLFTLSFSACKKAPRELPKGWHGGIVKESENVTQYTYLKVALADEERWIAAPQGDFVKGDSVFFTDGLKMDNFKSPSSGKDYGTVYFVDQVSKTPPDMNGNVNPTTNMGDMQNMPGGKNPHSNVGTDSKIDVKVDKAEYTIADIYKNKASLKEKVITVRGKVTKVNTGIMGKNWIHIQDGTSFENTYELTINSEDVTEVGKIVLIKGTLVLDKDFGSGYMYNVLVQDAKIKAE